MTTANIKMQRIGGLYETQFQMQIISFAKIMAMQDAVIQDSIPIAILGGLWRSPGENKTIIDGRWGPGPWGCCSPSLPVRNWPLRQL